MIKYDLITKKILFLNKLPIKINLFKKIYYIFYLRSRSIIILYKIN
jgi:hypothetical protein